MVMSRNTAIGSIVTGSIMVCFAVVSVICGAISLHKLSGVAAASAGFWSFYVFVPGIFSIVAGAKKNGVVMGFALFFNVIAVIISAVASIILIIFIATLNKVMDANQCHTTGYGSCFCTYDDYTSRTVIWNMKCSELGTLHSVISVLLIVYLILIVTSFTASIFGCVGTCCAPVDPIVVVTTGVPFQVTRGLAVLSLNQSTMHAGHSGQVLPAAYAQPPAYGQAQPSAYGDIQPPAYETKSGF